LGQKNIRSSLTTEMEGGRKTFTNSVPRTTAVSGPEALIKRNFLFVLPCKNFRGLKNDIPKCSISNGTVNGNVTETDRAMLTY
jgi:hypothetical protein